MGGGKPTLEVEPGSGTSNDTCMNTGICNSNTPRNSSIYLKAKDNNGNWTYVPYPDEWENFPILDPNYYSYASCQATTTRWYAVWGVSC